MYKYSQATTNFYVQIIVYIGKLNLYYTNWKSDSLGPGRSLTAMIWPSLPAAQK